MADDIVATYSALLDTENQERSHKQEHYHASSAGMCIRKHYFAVTEGVKQNPPDESSLRRLRLGTIVHTDIQRSFLPPLNNPPNKDTYLIEQSIYIKELNVSGRIDFYNKETKQLTDLKTIGGYKWQKLFGRYGDTSSVENYKMQLGTYAAGIEETLGLPVEQLFLLFYKLGDPKASDMRSLEVPLEYKQKALDYWGEVNRLSGDGPPPIKIGSSPVESWECSPKWCPFFEHCGGGLKPELLENV